MIWHRDRNKRANQIITYENNSTILSRNVTNGLRFHVRFEKIIICLCNMIVAFAPLSVLFQQKIIIKINKAKATFTGRRPGHTQVGHPEGTKQNKSLII
jgi:hypothetical protein